MDLSELVAGLDVSLAANRGGPCRVCDITEDSRTVVPGSLFIARKGLKADGKRYIQDAANAGAVAVLTDDPDLTAPEGFRLPILFAANVPLVSALLAERFYGHPTRSLKLSGVTGTNGKSTITYLIHQLMNHADHRCGLIGTVLVDDGTEVARASMTTPPALELSRTFAVMKEAGCCAASIEVSSHALDQHRADALAFDVAVFTNLTGDHLDYHKTMDNYAAAKARLFELLPAGATAIVNADDLWTPRMVRDCKARVWRCALNAAPNEADPAGPDECRATVIEETMQGMLLAMEGPWGVIEAQVPLIGRYNAMNVLQAAAACFAKGLTREQLCAGLPELQAPPGRLQKVSRDGADDITVFVDYAHSDDSLGNCLASVAKVIPGRLHGGGMLRHAAGTHRASPLPPRLGGGPATGRLWVVFGCGGNKDTTKRPRMGAAAIAHADMVVVTSDNPRSERPSDIIDQILAGIPQDKRDRVTVQADRGRAIRHAIEHAAAGDVVVLAGKGHENEQVVAGPDGDLMRVHFDDAQQAHAALDSRRAHRASRPAAGPQ